MTETFCCFSSCPHHFGLFNCHVVKRWMLFFFRTHNAAVGASCVSGEVVVWMWFGFSCVPPPTLPPALKLFWCVAKGLSSSNLSRLASCSITGPLLCLLHLSQAREHCLSACLDAGLHRTDSLGVTSTFVTSLLHLPDKSGV